MVREVTHREVPEETEEVKTDIRREVPGATEEVIRREVPEATVVALVGAMVIHPGDLEDLEAVATVIRPEVLEVMAVEDLEAEVPVTRLEVREEMEEEATVIHREVLEVTEEATHREGHKTSEVEDRTVRKVSCIVCFLSKKAVFYKLLQRLNS